MKAIETTLVLNNNWGYCYAPQTFPSRKKALAYARKMISDGYAFAYRML